MKEGDRVLFVIHDQEGEGKVAQGTIACVWFNGGRGGYSIKGDDGRSYFREIEEVGLYQKEE